MQPPADGEVHVWCDHLAQMPDDLAALDATERARARRFVYANHAASFSKSRSWLRRILARYLGCSPAEVPLGRAPEGKPLLIGVDPALEFNLTHSAALVMLAVSRQVVGIDVENDESLANVEAAAPLVFTDAERFACVATGRPDTLLWYWVAKEAVLKAWGVGFSVDPKDVEVRLEEDGTGTACSVGNRVAETSYLKCSAIRGSSVWAVASVAPIHRVHVLEGCNSLSRISP